MSVLMTYYVSHKKSFLLSLSLFAWLLTLFVLFQQRIKCLLNVARSYPRVLQ
jgi:hypothetical protein